LVQPGPGAFCDVQLVCEETVSEAMALDMWCLTDMDRAIEARREGFVDRAVALSRAKNFTRRQVAEWWSLFDVVIPETAETYANEMGYTLAQMARTVGQFHLAHLHDSETYGTAFTAKPKRLTPVHAHVHRLAARDGWWCGYCGVELTCACDTDLDMPVAVSDHVIPQSRGGSNDDTNRVLACVSCNSAKGDRTPGEWGRPLWGWCA
jgi:hypothetical protein